MAVLKAFNPHDLSAGVVLGVATGREKPLEQILAVVRANLTAHVTQHIIVSAPRGYGKSFFLRYVQVKVAEMAKTECCSVAMALLSEELPHVKEPDTLIAEIKRTFLSEPADTIAVRWVEGDASAWDEEVSKLDAAVENGLGGKRGLLVAGVENFDLLVKKAFGKSVQSARLREFLTRPGNRVMLIAASARGAFDRSYDVPLFKVFDEIALEPWTVPQTVEFLIAQRRTAQKPPFTDAQLAKASAVATFISGTPRLATLIGGALLEDDPLGAAELLDRIVDELTPYYKERIEVLPARSQALLDALLRGGENCSATELAKRVGAPSQSAIAAPLEDLKKDLVVIGRKAPDSAEVLISVADRVFAHYYRKRILSHGLELCPLEALVDILALIYSPEEKWREAEKYAAKGLTREAAIMKRLWEADNASREHLGVTAIGEIKALLEEWDRVTEGNLEQGTLILESTLTLARKSSVSDFLLASVLSLSAWSKASLGRHEDALSEAVEAIELGSRDNRGEVVQSTLETAAACLMGLKRFSEALQRSNEAVEWAEKIGDPKKSSRALRLAAQCLDELERYDEAVVVSKEAAEKAAAANDFDGEITSLTNASWSAMRRNRNDEAFVSARRAFDLAEQTIGQKPLEKRPYVTAAAALLVTQRADIASVLRAYRWILRNGEAKADEGPEIFFSFAAKIAMIDRNWLGFIELVEEFPSAAKNIVAGRASLGEPGRVLGVLLAEGDRLTASELTRRFVAALSQSIENASDTVFVHLWSSVITASTEVVASMVSDVEYLSELAKILDAHHAAPARAKMLISASASYHERQRDPRALARLDPDLATMLTTAFPARSLDKSVKKKPDKRKKRS